MALLLSMSSFTKRRSVSTIAVPEASLSEYIGPYDLAHSPNLLRMISDNTSSNRITILEVCFLRWNLVKVANDREGGRPYSQ